MRSFATTAVAAVAALAPVASAAVAAVQNHCDKPFYLWSVGQQVSDQVVLPNKSVVYNETFQDLESSGVSIKISSTETMDNDHLSQFEYTTDKAMNLVFYDVSQVNNVGKLWDVDYTLTTSDPSCPAVKCKANEKCTDVYNNWDDNAATHACGINQDLIFTLCPDGSSTGSSGGSSDGSSGKSATDGTDAPAKVASFLSSGTTTEGNKLSVGPDGKVYSDNTDKPVGDAIEAPTTSGSTSSSDDSPIVFKHPVYSGTPAKRSLQSHLHQHAQHSRLRRSRIFRR